MATTAELEARIRELEEKLQAMESDRRMSNVLDEVFPRESRQHMRAAWREQLLAMRSVLDHWIEKQENGGGTKRRESIRVD
jgi:hypothetical protein